MINSQQLKWSFLCRWTNLATCHYLLAHFTSLPVRKPRKIGCHLTKKLQHSDDDILSALGWPATNVALLYWIIAAMQLHCINMQSTKSTLCVSETGDRFIRMLSFVAALFSTFSSAWFFSWRCFEISIAVAVHDCSLVIDLQSKGCY